MPFHSLANETVGETSFQVAARVSRARERQRARYGDQGTRTNADLKGRQLGRHCALDRESLLLLERAMRRLRLTGPGFDRVRGVARTIADLDGAQLILKAHLGRSITVQGTCVTLKPPRRLSFAGRLW